MTDRQERHDDHKTRAELRGIITEDVLTIRRAQKQLKNGENRYQLLFESAIDMIHFVDEQHRIVDVNKTELRRLGYSREELIGKHVTEIIHPDHRPVTEGWIPTVRGGQTIDSYETALLAKDGTKIFVIVNVAPIMIDGEFQGAQAIIHDITDRKRVEEELRRSERLTVLGQLAGGMAHKLRHPLGSIKNAAYFLNMVLDEPEPKVKETLEILDQEVGNSERIIQSLLDFASPKPPMREKVELGRSLSGLLATISVPDSIEVGTEIATPLPTLLADPSQVEQAFRNVIVNALQAMPDGGRLTVRAEATGSDAVVVSVSDTGAGISPENLEQVFEPLFTTKAKGIGLGLALAKLFIEAHDGTITAESEEGKGTTIIVRLPITELAEEA